MGNYWSYIYEEEDKAKSDITEADEKTKREDTPNLNQDILKEMRSYPYFKDLKTKYNETN